MVFMDFLRKQMLKTAQFHDLQLFQATLIGFARLYSLNSSKNNCSD